MFCDCIWSTVLGLCNLKNTIFQVFWKCLCGEVITPFWRSHLKSTSWSPEFVQADVAQCRSDEELRLPFDTFADSSTKPHLDEWQALLSVGDPFQSSVRCVSCLASTPLFALSGHSLFPLLSLARSVKLYRPLSILLIRRPHQFYLQIFFGAAVDSQGLRRCHKLSVCSGRATRSDCRWRCDQWTLNSLRSLQEATTGRCWACVGGFLREQKFWTEYTQRAVRLVAAWWWWDFGK